MNRLCDACGRTYLAKRANSKYCSDTCRKRGQRKGLAGRPPKESPVVVVDNPDPAGEVSAAVLERLVEVGRDGTPDGVMALALARRLDSPGADTGSAVAAVARQLQATLDRALEGVAVAADPLDELRARRERKLHAG